MALQACCHADLLLSRHRPTPAALPPHSRRLRLAPCAAAPSFLSRPAPMQGCYRSAAAAYVGLRSPHRPPLLAAGAAAACTEQGSGCECAGICLACGAAWPWSTPKCVKCKSGWGVDTARGVCVR